MTQAHVAKTLVTDELWAVVEPLLPPELPKPRGGRPRIDARAVLMGILFVLKTGIPWEMLPKEMGYESGMTCWRRLREWQATGVWERLHHTLLHRLAARQARRRLATIRQLSARLNLEEPWHTGGGKVVPNVIG